MKRYQKILGVMTFITQPIPVVALGMNSSLMGKMVKKEAETISVPVIRNKYFQAANSFISVRGIYFEQLRLPEIQTVRALTALFAALGFTEIDCCFNGGFA